MRDKIVQRDLAEFYVLGALTPVIEQQTLPIHNKLINYRNNLVLDISQFYLEHLQHACVQEACHDGCRSLPSKKKRQYLADIGLTKNSQVTEDFLYARKNKEALSNTLESAKRLIYVFRYMKWSPSYGGEAWAKIAELYQKLLYCKNSFTALNDEGYDPYVGYDIYTYSKIKDIRASLDGAGANKIHKTMHIIDMIHQVEHNTGSVFTKFPDSMTSWLEKLLNEKAIACSIQVLRDTVGVEIKNILQELNVEDHSESIIEQQLGQIIIARKNYLNNKKQEEQFKQQVKELDDDLEYYYITEEEYNNKKKLYERNIQKENVATYSLVLSEYDSLREQRGILREIVELSNSDDNFTTEQGHNIVEHIEKNLYRDYETFKILSSSSKWHSVLILPLMDHLNKIPFKWRNEAYDFLRSTNSLPEKAAQDISQEDKDFITSNIGKPIVGKKDWISGSVNIELEKSSYVNEDYPIGTILGLSKTGNLCFTPSLYWKEYGYNAETYDVDVCNIELYDHTKPITVKKPYSFISFAKTYAGKKIKFKKDVAANWNRSLPAGIVIGYAKNIKNAVFYIPTDEFKAAGYLGYQNKGNIIYTSEEYNNDNTPLCYYASFNEIAPYTDVDNKQVDVYDVMLPPVPPKGGNSVKDFATKYTGKKIKATYNFGFALNAVNRWDVGLPIGTIIGYVDNSKYGSSNKLCFIPSDELQERGWGGNLNFDDFIYTDEQYKGKPYYTVNWNNIELFNAADYEHQADDDNRKYVMTYSGKDIVNYSSAWKSLIGYKNGEEVAWNTRYPIGKVVGYKGSLLCYTPSKELIDLGFYGEDLDGVVYTHKESTGKKCYTLISTSNIMEYNKPYGKKLKEDKGPIGLFNKTIAELFVGKKVKKINNNIDGWDKDKIIGTIVGYKKYSKSIVWKSSEEYSAFTPGAGHHESIKFCGEVADDIHWCYMSNLEICDDLNLEQQAAYFAIKCAISKHDGIQNKTDKKYLGFVVGYTGEKICYIPLEHMTDDDAIDFKPVVSSVVPGTTLVRSIHINDIELWDKPKLIDDYADIPPGWPDEFCEELALDSEYNQ